MFPPTTHWFVSYLATTIYLCWQCHSPLLDKEDYFIYLLTVAFSFAIPHGTHQLVPTHPFFFWVVCHPSRTSPPKEYEGVYQNRLSLLPSARPYPLLPLTHDPPLLYWLGTSWWCLGLACAPLPVHTKACLLLMRLLWSGGSFVHYVAYP